MKVRIEEIIIDWWGERYKVKEVREENEKIVLVCSSNKGEQIEVEIRR